MMLYLPVQIQELPFRFWGLSGRVIETNTVLIPSWNHNGICTGKWNGNKNFSCSLDFTQTRMCIKSWNMYFLFCIFDCYRFFYKVLQHLFKLLNIFLSLCILRKTISVLVLGYTSVALKVVKWNLPYQRQRHVHKLVQVLRLSTYVTPCMPVDSQN